MKKYLITAAAGAAALMMIAAGNTKDDPVLMKVNGRDVHKSEFEYLYHKNNTQQLQPQSIDRYVDMFVNYKLKVADAEAAGIDTTAAFRKEFEGFRNELASPYMRDTTVEEQLIEEAYEHLKEDVMVSHIMLALERDPAGTKANERRLDSLRNEILAGRADFADIAARYSIDRGSSNRGGKMGAVVPGRFPWPFEKAAYETKAGEISPVVNSGMGLHIIRVDERRPSRGEVLVEHILKLTRGVAPDKQDSVKAVVDSLYLVLKGGADFNEMAKKESQDPGSAQRGGKLDWFGTGVMVAPFDSAAFATPVGEISAPFPTAYGYHILHKLDKRGVPSLADSRERIKGMIARDERSMMPERAKIDEVVARYKGTVNKGSLDKIKELIAANPGGYDSTMVAALSKMDLPVYNVDGKDYPVSSVMPMVAHTASNDADNAVSLIGGTAVRVMEMTAMDVERDHLADTNPDYRNLLNEYRDGMLLFEISNINVWDKAAKDKEGLEKYFKAHRDKYTWDQPRFKSYIFFASSDSLLNAAIKFADDSLANVAPENFAREMRRHFGSGVKVERVIAAKGENAITDYLGFGQEKPGDDASRWAYYAAYKGHVIDKPEEVADVKAAVTTDYQAELEKAWVEKLRKKYPVKIDKKVLKTVK